MATKHKTTLMTCLLLLNIAAIVIFGGRYLYQANLKRQEDHKRAQVTANTLTKAGLMDAPEAIRFEEISQSSQHGGNISGSDFEWCLQELNKQNVTPESKPARHAMIGRILATAAPSLDPAQKEELFQAMVAEIARDDPKSELGIDIAIPAHVFGKLGDQRAVPILQAHLDDPRPIVHKMVQKAMNRLEGKTPK